VVVCGAVRSAGVLDDQPVLLRRYIREQRLLPDRPAGWMTNPLEMD
jgi:hypothetical protein